MCVCGDGWWQDTVLGSVARGIGKCKNTTWWGVMERNKTARKQFMEVLYCRQLAYILQIINRIYLLKLQHRRGWGSFLLLFASNVPKFSNAGFICLSVSFSWTVYLCNKECFFICSLAKGACFLSNTFRKSFPQAFYRVLQEFSQLWETLLTVSYMKWTYCTIQSNRNFQWACPIRVP